MTMIKLGSVIQTLSMDRILTSRQALLESLQQSKEIEIRLKDSGNNLNKFRRNRDDLESDLNPLLTRFGECKTLEDSVDGALEPAMKVMRAMKEIRDMEVLIDGDDILRDPRKYMESLNLLERLMVMVRNQYPAMIEGLIGAIHVAGETGYLSDGSKMQIKLREAMESLDMDPNGYLRVGSDLMTVALDKLEHVFSRVLRRSCILVDLNKVDIQKDIAVITDDAGLHLMKVMVYKFRANGRENQALNVYRGVRLKFMRDSFMTANPTYLKLNTPSKIDELDWEELEGFLEEWIMLFKKTVKFVLEPERNLCVELFQGSCDWNASFGKMAYGTGLSALIDFGEAVALSHREPQKLFKLLDMVEGFESMKMDLSKVLEGPGCGLCALRLTEMEDKLVQSCIEVLEEFSNQIGKDSGLPRDGSTLKLTSYVQNYLKFMITEYGDLMEEVLRRGEKGDLKVVIGKIFGALESNLEARAKVYTIPGLAHIFLMNNYWYLFKRSRDSKLGQILGHEWLKQRKRQVNQHVFGYEKEVWGSLLSILSKEGLMTSSNGGSNPGYSKGCKDLLKQRFLAFNTAFEKTYETHKTWVITDEELREGTYVKIVQCVIPAYRSYVNTFGKLLDPTENRHIRYLPEGLEEMLSKLFPTIIGSARQDGGVERH